MDRLQEKIVQVEEKLVKLKERRDEYSKVGLHLAMSSTILDLDVEIKFTKGFLDLLKEPCTPTITSIYHHDALSLKVENSTDEVYCKNVDYAVQDLDAILQGDKEYHVRFISTPTCYYNAGLDQLASLRNGTQLVQVGLVDINAQHLAAGAGKSIFKKKPYTNIIYLKKGEQPHGVFYEGKILMAQIL